MAGGNSNYSALCGLWVLFVLQLPVNCSFPGSSSLPSLLEFHSMHGMHGLGIQLKVRRTIYISEFFPLLVVCLAKSSCLDLPKLCFSLFNCNKISRFCFSFLPVKGAPGTASQQAHLFPSSEPWTTCCLISENCCFTHYIQSSSCSQKEDIIVTSSWAEALLYTLWDFNKMKSTFRTSDLSVCKFPVEGPTTMCSPSYLPSKYVPWVLHPIPPELLSHSSGCSLFYNFLYLLNLNFLLLFLNLFFLSV